MSPMVCKLLLEKVQMVNWVDPVKRWLPLIVENENVGAVLAEDAEMLCTRGGDVLRSDGKSVRFSENLERASSVVRTEAVAEMTQGLRENGIVKGWRNELVPVATGFGETPKFLVERAVYPILGAKGYGVHVNGFCKTQTGLSLWVAKRALDKPTWPGLLDHIVAGHQPVGMTPSENVIKEAGEEAGIPEELARTAKARGAVSYRGQDEDGRLKNDVLFCFDLELSLDFVPRPVDGEVDSFELLSLDIVIDLILQGKFKPNVVLVIVDFLFRHGVLEPELSSYLELISALRQGDCR